MFDLMMTDTVLVAPETGIDENGDPTFGSTTSISAYVNYDQEINTGTDGELRGRADVVYTHEEIEHTDVLYLPQAPRTPRYVESLVYAEHPVAGESLYEVVLA